jgi:hypothetical protein
LAIAERTVSKILDHEPEGAEILEDFLWRPGVRTQTGDAVVHLIPEHDLAGELHSRLGYGLLDGLRNCVRRNRVVAPVKDGICLGCGVGASSSRVQHARSGVELIYCGTCGRILYVA